MTAENPLLSHLRQSRSSNLGDLAEQLRDGPLRQLLELQAEISELADRAASTPESPAEELERLVRMSLAAMEHFHAFTREFAAALRELTDAHRHAH